MAHRMKGRHRYCTKTDACPHCPKFDNPRFAYALAGWVIHRGLHDCVHLGMATGNKVLCPSCSGRVELKLFACTIHGDCTRGKAVPDTACCTTCEEYQPR